MSKLDKSPQPPKASQAINTDDDDEKQCRVCTIQSDCFTYVDIFDKMIFKNVGVAEALEMVTSMQVCLANIMFDSNSHY